MKKIMFLVMITTILLSWADNDLKEADLKGKVKSCSIKIFKPGSEENDWILKYETAGNDISHYDEDGKLVKKEMFKSDDSKLGITLYSYDPNGNLLVQKDYIGKNELYQTYTYSYDSAGNEISEIKTDQAGNLIYTWIYLYKNGFLTESVCKQADGSISDQFIYVNDENGNPIELTVFQQEYFQYKTYYKYDSKNRIVREDKCNSIDELIKQTAYKYNANGKLTLKTLNDIDGNITRYEYTYNDRSQEKSEAALLNIDLLYSNEYEYNENGDMTKHIYKDKNGESVITYKYEYDQFGNWIEKIKSENGEAVEKTEKVIEYWIVN